MEFKRFGVMLNSLGHNQLNFYLAKQINDRTRKQGDINCNLFYQDLKPIAFPPMTPVFQSIEVNGFEAPVVATSLQTAFKLINAFGPTKKYFYLFNLEWIVPQQLNYEQLANIYCNPEIELIVRNHDHKVIVENCWNRKPIGILDDFNLEQLLGYICPKK